MTDGGKQLDLGSRQVSAALLRSLTTSHEIPIPASCEVVDRVIASDLARGNDRAYTYHDGANKVVEINPQGGDPVHLKIVRASDQYVYDDTNTQYLDCVNSVSHVGHCHSAVVQAVSGTVGSLGNSSVWEFDHGNIRYPTELQKCLPDHLNTYLFCNSGSEAVDLAMQLSRLYTRGHDVLVVDNAFHGSVDSVHHLSPKVYKANNIAQVDWVHVVPMPDLYRGPYQADDPLAVQKYLADARDVLDKARVNGRKFAAFICEPMLVIQGCQVPPAVWLQDMYRLVREVGGLCIADEVQTGLGRIGTHVWGFQAQGVTPDILIIGKAIGNGYPMAAVATSKEIAAALGDRIKDYQCSAVMDAVGCAVLDVMQQGQLMTAAAAVGRTLREELRGLQRKHEYIGEVRGQGLMFGLEIVWDKQSKKPSREIAEEIVQRLKSNKILAANEGNNRNIIIIMPPMCFNQENAAALTDKLDKVLRECAHNRHELQVLGFSTTEKHEKFAGVSEGRLGILQPQQDSDDGCKDDMDLEYAHQAYQDLD